MKTACINCGLILTSESGVRMLSANFDSMLPGRRGEPDILWARCDVCYAVSRGQRSMHPSIERVADREPEEQEQQREPEPVRAALSPAQRRKAGERFCPLCYTFGDSHRLGCLNQYEGTSKHVTKEERSKA